MSRDRKGTGGPARPDVRIRQVSAERQCKVRPITGYDIEVFING